VGAGVTRGQVDQLSKVITRPHNDLHPGHTELAVVLIDHGREALDQRSRDIPRPGVIGLAEYRSEATLNAFNLCNIELPMSRPGDEARDDDDLGDEIDQGTVRFTIAQTLKRDPCTQRKI